MRTDRQTLLWALVAFFGASIAFNAVNDATAGEALVLRIGAQLLALGLIVGAIVLFMRRRS